MNYFQAGQPLQIGDILVSPFTIPHDAVDPVGFVFQAEGVRMAVATDLGYVTPNVKAQLKKLDLLLLESNHDLEMLRDGPYPWSVKQTCPLPRRPSFQRGRSPIPRVRIRWPGHLRHSGPSL